MTLRTVFLRRTKRAAIPLVLVLLAYALRVWGLQAHNIWWDEGIGVWLSRMPLLEGIRWTAGDVHPPLYYILLHGWRRLVGEGEFTLRYLSVLFSTLTVPVIYHLGRLCGGRRVGLLAMLFLALSRFAIWWAQEIRMYALAMLCTTASLTAALRLWRDLTHPHDARRRTSAWRVAALYVLTTLAGLYSLYLAGLVLIITNLGFLAMALQMRRRRWWWTWIGTQAAILLAFLPWLLFALPRMHSWSSDQPFTLGFFMQLYLTVLAVGTPVEIGRWLPLVSGVGLGLLTGVVALARQSHSPARRAALLTLTAGLLISPLVVAIISLPMVQFYISRPLAPRYLLPLAGSYLTLLAWGIAALSRARGTGPYRGPARLIGLSLSGLALAASLGGLATYYPGRMRTDDFLTISRVLKAHRRPDEAVLLYVDRDWPVFVAHYDGPRVDLPYAADWDDPATVASRLGPLWEQAEGVWLVTTPESLQADPAKAVPRWLAARAVMSQTLVTGPNTLTFYARTEDRANALPEIVLGLIPTIRLESPFGLIGADIPLRRYKAGDTLHLSLYWIPPTPSEATLALVHRGKVQRTFPLTFPTASVNIIRTQVNLALTPDLPPGRYDLLVQVPGAASSGSTTSIHVGRISLRRQADARRHTTTEVPNPVDYRLGENIHLVGFRLTPSQIKPGDTVHLTLYWRTDAVLHERYKVFTHVLGETFNPQTGNFLWGQRDQEPLGGRAPTTAWLPGALLEDPYTIPLDPQTPPGRYVIEVGLYRLTDGVRLPAYGTEGPLPEGAIHLTTLEVLFP